MGTPAFAVPCLERLVADGHTVRLVVTRADQPKGRGHKLTPPPVKVCAAAHGLPVYQPPTLRSPQALERLRQAQAEVFVVTAYGRLLPPEVLALPRFGCVNLHGSLLPRYRGAAPIQRAVLDGARETGITAMQMDEGLDTGDMLLARRMPIPPDMTAGELQEALAPLAAEVMAETLAALQAETLVPVPQEDAAATCAPMLDKSLSPLDFTRPAAALHNQARGLHPWPCATCACGESVWKIHRTAVGETADGAAPGTVVALDPLTVACGGGGTLIIREMQPPGGRRMAAADYLRGHPLAVGTVLTGKPPEQEE